MKVKELIEKLSTLNPDAECIVAQNDGGSPLNSIGTTYVYTPENTWYGELYDQNWSADDACMEDEEWEEFQKKSPCVLFEPVN